MDPRTDVPPSVLPYARTIMCIAMLGLFCSVVAAMWAVVFEKPVGYGLSRMNMRKRAMYFTFTSLGFMSSGAAFVLTMLLLLVHGLGPGP